MSIEAQEQTTPNPQSTKDLNMENRVLFTEMEPRTILADLGEGLTREEIAMKYKYFNPNTRVEEPLTLTQVNLMFNDPALKGKRPSSKKKALPFLFKATRVEELIPEVAPTTASTTTEPVEEETSDSNTIIID